MKSNIIYIAIFITVCLTSCYKDFYQASIQQNESLTKKNETLTKENSALLQEIQQLQNQHNNLNSESIQLNSEIKTVEAENLRLKRLQISEITQVKSAILAYLGTVSKIAHDQSPPCKNAANGWMREYIAGANVKKLSDPELTLETSAAKQLLGAYKAFSIANENAFVNNTNYTANIKEVFFSWAGDIWTAIMDVIQMINASDANDKAYSQTAIDVKDYYMRVKDGGICHTGTHANGHISEGVKSASNIGLTKLSAINVENSYKAQLIKIELIKYFRTLQTLNTEKHEPWLKAEWQLKYYACTSYAVKKISEIN